ncbi:hypothetical protein KP509_03G063900 [Ceratopteris richardii]|uniref:Pentatricopeptide repeat-containing protein-mitochondrial domain-containing protein n=1 Tax=Ceratopteris richardii TaxID=49495 RepID=A0A8T2V4M7_CERRI|nr:hypothetical protein KP509_03G063900 [Ceratopteris richardii]KAH7441961.1 hypothetical protein KP509_03G063900 [Ceratopteris richardii]
MFSSACRIVKRNFSAVVASSKLDWHDIFDGCFGNSLPGRSVENLSVSSFSSLLDIPERGPCSEIASNRSSQSGLGAEDIQLIKDVGLPQFFGHLIDELSIDHAILFCSKLTDKNEIAKRVLQLLLHSRDKHCILSVETNRKLEKWLRNGRDAPSFKNNLQALCHKSMDGDEPISVEETFGDNLTHLDSMGKWSKSLITRKLSDIPGKVGCTDVSYTTGLGNALYKLGKSSSPGRLEERFLQFAQLHQKGVSEKAFRRLIECFARGLIENPGDIARMISVFKNVTGSLRLDLLPSFNIFIGHCANHGKIDLCIDLIQTIKARGLEPCSLSYEPLIKYFARTLQISKAEDILKVMDLSGMQVTVKAYEAVIAAHAKLRNFERAYNLIERIHSGDLKPDLYTPIIFNYAMKGHVSLALSVFHQMKRRGVKPNADNFATLIRACAHRRNSQGAEKVRERILCLCLFGLSDEQAFPIKI